MPHRPASAPPPRPPLFPVEHAAVDGLPTTAGGGGAVVVAPPRGQALGGGVSVAAHTRRRADAVAASPNAVGGRHLSRRRGGQTCRRRQECLLFCPPRAGTRFPTAVMHSGVTAAAALAVSLLMPRASALALRALQ